MNANTYATTTAIAEEIDGYKVIYGMFRSSGSSIAACTYCWYESSNSTVTIGLYNLGSKTIVTVRPTVSFIYIKNNS